MAKGSFGRTVARAAASGGSRGYRARSPIAWYALLTAIVIAGVGLIVYSRYERQHPSSSAATSVPPRKGDHWYAALAFDVCGRVQPALAPNTNLSSIGIRTYGDGIIDIDPGAASTPAAYEGANATLGTFVAHYRGLLLSATTLGLPTAAASVLTTTTSPSTSSTTTTTSPKTGTTGTKSTAAAKAAKATTTTSSTTTTTLPITKPLLTSGASCTSSLGPLHGRAVLQVKVWSSPTAKGALLKGDPTALELANGQMITVAFVPPGSSIPEPPSKAVLLGDLGSPKAATPGATGTSSSTISTGAKK